MSIFLRLLRLFGTHNSWLLLGLGLALLALAAQGALMLAALGTLSAAALAIGLLKTVVIARPVLRYLERLITHSATFRILTRLRLWLFARLVPLAPVHLGTARSGDVLARLLGDIDALDGLYLRLLLPASLCLVGTTTGLVLLAGVSPLLAVTLALLFAGLLIVLIGLVHLHRHALQQLPTLSGSLRTHIMDGCTGLPELLAAQAADEQLHRISLASANFNRAQLMQARLRALTLLATSLTAALVLAVLLLQLPLTATVGIMLTVIGLAMALLETFPGLASASQQWPGLQAASQRIFSLADTPPAVNEPEAPQELPTDLSLQFDQVTLSYGRPRPALKDFSLTIAPGERLWISGPSGAGKTSLLNLLLKFRQPDSGEVKVGGISLRNVTGDVWRSKLAYLSQHTALLAGTIADNLRLAKADASTEQMFQALSAAGLAEFVRGLPDGLDNWIGESGAQLSGGQARRLALAQVLLRDAPIWLLDEPTEGLDGLTAQAVMTTLAGCAHGKTVLLVSHQEALAPLLAPTRRLELRPA
jgi:ATP-binding cassette subfamily C protein CydC